MGCCKLLMKQYTSLKDSSCSSSCVLLPFLGIAAVVAGRVTCCCHSTLRLNIGGQNLGTGNAVAFALSGGDKAKQGTVGTRNAERSTAICLLLHNVRVLLS